jgi:hypothetical protein
MAPLQYLKRSAPGGIGSSKPPIRDANIWHFGKFGHDGADRPASVADSFRRAAASRNSMARVQRSLSGQLHHVG